MSDLQCAARLLLVAHGEAEPGASEGGGLAIGGRLQARELATSLRDARVAAVYCSTAVPAVQTAEIVAGPLGVPVWVRAGLGAWSPEELGAIVDQHRGETVVAVGDGDALATALPPLVRNLSDKEGARHELGPCASVEVDADADGWVVRSWSGVPV